MILTTLAAAVLLQAAQPPDAEVRSLTMSVVDAQGAPITGLVRDDVAVLENGVAREVASVEPDTTPLVVAVLVDNSQEVGSAYRLHVVDPVASLLAHLPEGARFTVWTTGDRPTKVTDLGDDVAAATGALKRSLTTGGNTVLDAVVEATRDLKKQEGSRSAVVVVTGMTTSFANRDRRRVVEEARKNADLFLVVQFQEGGADVEARTDYGYVFDMLTKKTGGLYEMPLSAMGVAQAVKKLEAELRRYRVSYATLPEIKDRKLEVQVARPGAKVRVTPPVQGP
ncbi:MAG: VWA domain-containing protein [Vicinamibacteria bacterium]